MYAVLEREREREREAATLLPIIEGSVRSGTSVMSGLWTAYGGMQVMLYTHLSINRTYEFVDTALELPHKTWRIHGKTSITEIKSNMGHIAPCLIAIYVIISGKSDMEIINCLAESLQTLLLIFRLCN